MILGPQQIPFLSATLEKSSSNVLDSDVTANPSIARTVSVLMVHPLENDTVYSVAALTKYHITCRTFQYQQFLAL